MSEDKELVKLKDKVELLSNIVLSTDIVKGLCIIALQNEWNMDKVNAILNIMTNFLYKKNFTYKDLESILRARDLDEKQIFAVIQYLAHTDMYAHIAKVYVETLLLEKGSRQDTSMYVELKRMLDDKKILPCTKQPLQGIRGMNFK